MDEKDKKIAALENEVAELKKHTARMTRALSAFEKKLNRVYHDHNSVAVQVNAITSTLRRSPK